MALPGRIARSLRGWRPGNGARVRRKLAGIERGLATEARLAAMFAMFNALTRGERPTGAEPFPSPAGALGLSARWLTRTAALLAMAAIIIGGLLLSSMVRPVDRSCLMLTANGRPVTIPVAAPVAVGASEAAGHTAPASTGHESGCPAYPAK
jgi:hypothetical protein